MNSMEIGKEFEKKAYDFLLERYDKVEWLSEKNWITRVDFACYKDGIKYMIDARKNQGNLITDKPIDYFVTFDKKGENIILIKPKKIIKHCKLIQIDLTAEENQIAGMLKHLFNVVSKEEAIKILIKSTGETLIANTINENLEAQK